MGAVLAPGDPCGRARVVDPTLGQDARAIPAAVAQVQQAETRKVARRGEHEARPDEVPGAIEARRGRPHADAIEELPVHELQHARLAAPNGAAHDGGDDVRGAARIVPAGSRRAEEWPRFGVPSDVLLARAEEHLDDVRGAAVHVVLDEVEPVHHVEHVIEGNRRSWITRLGPAGHQARLMNVELAVAHQSAQQRVADALRHGPGDERRAGVEVAGVLLQRELASLNDHQSVRLAGGLGGDLCEELATDRLDARAIHCGARLRLRPALAGEGDAGRLRREREER